MCVIASKKPPMEAVRRGKQGERGSVSEKPKPVVGVGGIDARDERCGLVAHEVEEGGFDMRGEGVGIDIGVGAELGVVNDGDKGAGVGRFAGEF